MPIDKRKKVEEKKYTGVDISHVIWNLREGDKLHLVRRGKTYNDKSVIVTDYRLEESIVKDEEDVKYRLVGKYFIQGWMDSFPWLRTVPSDESAGEVSKLTVEKLQ